MPKKNARFLTGLANGISAIVLLLNAPLYAYTAPHFMFIYTLFAALSGVFFGVAIYLRRRSSRISQMQDSGLDWDVSEHGVSVRSPDGHGMR